MEPSPCQVLSRWRPSCSPRKRSAVLIPLSALMPLIFAFVKLCLRRRVTNFFECDGFSLLVGYGSRRFNHLEFCDVRKNNYTGICVQNGANMCKFECKYAFKFEALIVQFHPTTRAFCWQGREIYAPNNSAQSAKLSTYIFHYGRLWTSPHVFLSSFSYLTIQLTSWLIY